MRIFATYSEALNEVQRDLKEMGIRVHTTTMQDKVIDSKPDEFDTVEIQNYIYTVTSPNTDELSPTQPWATQEFADRINGLNGSLYDDHNPGNAWSLREDMDWSDFLEVDGIPQTTFDHTNTELLRAAIRDKRARFAYTYAERLCWNSQGRRVINRLKFDPGTRQAYIAMWDPNLDVARIGVRRVPCSLGWHFMYRNGALDMTYFMRSCDFKTHFQNDVWLARRLQEYIAHECDMKPGRFCHYAGSLHVYMKDVAGVF